MERLEMKTHIQVLLTSQLVVMLFYMAVLWLFELGDIFSALTGCLASLIPGAYFAVKMLRQVDNNNAEQWLGYAYRSDIAKWLMTGIIFALAFTSTYQWDPVILFVGYLLMQVSGMFVPLIQKGN
jgi:F0F1-type ATP synthase assembly protein I